MKHLFTLLFVTISSIGMAQSQYETLTVDNVLDWVGTALLFLSTPWFLK
jgi:hypothetical protein